MNRRDIHKGILRAKEEERKHIPAIILLIIGWIIAGFAYYVIR